MEIVSVLFLIVGIVVAGVGTNGLLDLRDGIGKSFWMPWFQLVSGVSAATITLAFLSWILI